MSIKCNAAFEGGGVKGIGLVGAISVFLKKDYEFVNVVGSSAGAIVATLIAVGYKIEEIIKIMDSLDYIKFKQPSFLSNFGVIGKTLNIGLDLGIYEANYLEEWLYNLLAKKNKTLFKDIKRKNPKVGENIYKLQVTASDLTDKTLLIFPDDLKKFGINPDNFSIAKAVRMSMCIPIFYEPFILKDQEGIKHLIVDGGLLSNYPIWVLDNGIKKTEFPTFGFRFKKPKKESKSEINDVNFIEYLKMIAVTAIDSHDKEYISVSHGDYARSILIPTEITINGIAKNISTTHFSITKKEAKELFNNGLFAAEKFLKTWDYEKWLYKYRK